MRRLLLAAALSLAATPALAGSSNPIAAPVMTSTTLGIGRPDNTTITVTNGILTSLGSGGGVTAGCGLAGTTTISASGRRAVGNADATILSTDNYVALTAALTTTRTWTLPPANALTAGCGIWIAAESTTANSLTVSHQLQIASGIGDTINGGGSYPLYGDFMAVYVKTDGVSKWTVNSTVNLPECAEGETWVWTSGLPVCGSGGGGSTISINVVPKGLDGTSATTDSHITDDPAAGVSVTTSTVSGTDDGLPISLTAGNGGNGATGDGGQVSVIAGIATSTNGLGGPIVIAAGAGVGTGHGGTVDIDSGPGGATGNGGTITLEAYPSGAGATGNGGAIVLATGAASSTNGSGGNLTITLGAKTGSGTAGIMSILAGAGTVVGTATGGAKGVGTINMQGCYVNNVACATGGGISGLTTNRLPKATSATALGNSSFRDTSTGTVLATMSDLTTPGGSVFSGLEITDDTNVAGNVFGLEITTTNAIGGGTPQVIMNGFTGGGGGSDGDLIFTVAGGTFAAPTAITAGQELGAVLFRGYDGGGYSNTGGGSITFVAASNYSGTPSVVGYFGNGSTGMGVNTLGELVIGGVVDITGNTASPSIAAAQLTWNVGETPTGKIIYTATRPERVTAVLGRLGAANAGASTVKIQKVPSGTAPGSGTDLTSTTLNAAGTANTNQTLTLSGTAADDLLAAGDSLLAVSTGTFALSNGAITVHMAPN